MEAPGTEGLWGPSGDPDAAAGIQQRQTVSGLPAVQPRREEAPQQVCTWEGVYAGMEQRKLLTLLQDFVNLGAGLSS